MQDADRPSTACCTAGPTTSTPSPRSRPCSPAAGPSGHRAVPARLSATTRFLSADQPRAMASRRRWRADAVALMDALRYRDARSSPDSTGARGPRTSLAALWPERVARAGLGQRLPDRQPGGGPGAAAARGRAAPGGTSIYFATERGRLGYASVPPRVRAADLAARPRRNGRSTTPFSIARRRRSTIPIMSRSPIHNYRWRLGLADGEPTLRRDSRRGWRQLRRSPCPRSPWRATPTARRIRRRGLSRRNSPGPTRIGSIDRRHRPQPAAGGAATHFAQSGARRRQRITVSRAPEGESP